ncbi:hypothetical protein LCGC14_0983910 [marine sediment metagenome]|uniref:Uncharacterized protein n=1 Tax=marine sediment metagenome TaxID=412755 RepID=A0A0F9N7S5_9ZZZZ
MKKLAEILEARRLVEGSNGKPLGYLAWGKELGIIHTTLFRFSRGERTLGSEALRALATWAKSNDDNELLLALAGYVLIRFAEGDGSLGSEAIKSLAAAGDNDKFLFVLAGHALDIDLPPKGEG